VSPAYPERARDGRWNKVGVTFLFSTKPTAKPAAKLSAHSLAHVATVTADVPSLFMPERSHTDSVCSWLPAWQTPLPPPTRIHRCETTTPPHPPTLGPPLGRQHVETSPDETRV
jgi:hypothetical protein